MNAKALYSFKIWMFHGKFTPDVKHLYFSCVYIYVGVWLTASFPILAPFNDLSILGAYEMANASVSKVASTTFELQLWYLSEELVGLNFFDNNLSFGSLVKVRRSTNLKCIKLSAKNSRDMKIEYFVTKYTMDFFHHLNTPRDYLDCDSKTWHLRADY
ncbi:hypothetical protein PR048_008303 [Dryococelus australis]|uniref:Uncharacterized protein n=1 Tax=Dryococelus australis TaxID=614101 RepID=A0ABQ9HWR2_9NEOP|nr:hypothetical protein PR048_008303 [Dryococelus australis]